MPLNPNPGLNHVHAPPHLHSEAAQRSSCFLVSELMDGGTLKQLVMRQMATPHRALYRHEDALRWCTQVAEGLAYMHGMNPMVRHEPHGEA